MGVVTAVAAVDPPFSVPSKTKANSKQTSLILWHILSADYYRGKFQDYDTTLQTTEWTN